MAVRDRPADELMEEEPEQIAEEAADVGRERLDRSLLDVAITAFIGGIEVSIGMLAAMAVVGAVLTTAPDAPIGLALAIGALAFPIGFLFVIIGRSELFTENFLIPVVSVIRGERSPGSLVGLWFISWVANLLACAAVALLDAVPGTLGDSIHTGFRAYAEHKLAIGLTGVFTSAVLAGATMTLLTWLLLAVREPIAKIAAIFAAGYVLFAANLAHSIVGASALFIGYAPAGHSAFDVARWLAVATAGNLVGGVGLVTLFRLAQANEKERRTEGAEKPRGG